MMIECPSCGSEITIFAICVPPQFQLQCPHCDCVLRCDGDTIKIDRGVKTDGTMESEIASEALEKPPLGEKPCHIHAEQRIEDLSNAI